MKRTYRLVFLLVLLVAVSAGAFQAYVDRRRATAELARRLGALALGLQDTVADDLNAGKVGQLARILRQFSERDPTTTAVVCAGSRTIAMNREEAPPSEAPWTTICADSPALNRQPALEGQTRVLRAKSGDFLVYSRPLEGTVVGGRESSLVLVQSLAAVDEFARMVFFRALIAVLLGAAVALTVFRGVTRWVFERSMRYLVRWTRTIFRGPHFAHPFHEPDERLPEEFHELTKELSTLALKMRQERMRMVWSNEGRSQGAWARADGSAGGVGRIALGDVLRTKVAEVLRGRKLVIVANREPYLHEKSKGGEIKVVRPASGVVTALEPIMRICGGGVWVGHGSGSADREVVDDNDEVRVPPEHPTYTLRRVWLTPEEEQGYYYGFSNEGLWPLCHLAYTRPTFRLADWEMYKRVNRRFAEATLKNLDSSNAVILVQDYHYALLPRFLREGAPGASIELFWHIPWPNPEAFGICPQSKELLQSMLNADVVGFHTQFHCNNFLETCDRYLQARVDWERFSVTIGKHETLVRGYPISISTEPVARLTPERREELRRHYGISAEVIALGVDRLDYTKGLVERIAGVERFLEKYPQYVGRFSFVEMGTPSRTHIPSYRLLITEVEGAIERVNQRYGAGSYRPIVLLKGHFDWNEVAEFYQLGQACLVTSLHDGMNLVAKEYVWSQRAEDGALILSRFTGAARELSDAFIVNPYSSEEIADALFDALKLTPEERGARMRRMKEKVRNHNAFDWATDLLAGVNAKA